MQKSFAVFLTILFITHASFFCFAMQNDLPEETEEIEIQNEVGQWIKKIEKNEQHMVKLISLSGLFFTLGYNFISSDRHFYLGPSCMTTSLILLGWAWLKHYENLVLETLLKNATRY